MCRLKAQRLGGILKITGVGPGSSQVWPNLLENVPHPWDLSIFKHKANIIMKLSIYIDHDRKKGRVLCSHTYL